MEALIVLAPFLVIAFCAYQWHKQNRPQPCPLPYSNVPEAAEVSERWHGKLVIACPNEWDSMVIGKVIGKLPKSHEVLIVYDYVTQSERIVFSPRVEYSPAKLEELAALNPYERYNHLVGEMYAISLDKPKSGEEPLTVEDYRRIAANIA